MLDNHAEALAGVKAPQDKLDAVVTAHCAFFGSHLHEMKVMSREAEQLDGRFGEAVGELRRRYVRLMRGILEEIAEENGKRVVPTGTAVFLLFGMMNWMYTWYDKTRDGEPDEIARQVKRVFLEGFLG